MACRHDPARRAPGGAAGLGSGRSPRREQDRIGLNQSDPILLSVNKAEADSRLKPMRLETIGL